MIEGSEVLVQYPGFTDPIRGRIIEIRENECYVHFDGKDRRLDKFFDKSLLTPAQPQEQQNTDKKSNKEFLTLAEEKDKMRNIDEIQFGKHVINTWYLSPYPVDQSVRKLYICEYCMKYFTTLEDLKSHYAELLENTLPGREIYRKDDISVFEIKGKKQKIFCQCLSLLGKLFIEHKASYFDVDQFNYYVLCECDEMGAHTAAFYSCEANMIENILSCIVVLPPYQKKGYGRLLIDLSYSIASRAGIVSGPERPLSDLGHLAYLSYWRDKAMEIILEDKEDPGDLSVISAKTSIAKDDLAEALADIGVMRRIGRGMPLQIDFDAVDRLTEKYSHVSDKPHIDTSKLLWFKKGTFH